MHDDLIHDIAELTAVPQIDKAQMTHLVISMRKLTELMTETEQLQYPTLRLYCNWSAHPEIDKSALAAGMLHEIHQKLLTLMHIADNDRLIHGLSDAFSFPKLRTEMGAFLSNLGLSADVTTDDERWKAFCVRLLGNIRGAPIRFPSNGSNKVKQMQDAVTNTPLKLGMAVAEAKIIDVDKGLLRSPQVPTGESIVCMEILFTDGVKLIVPMTLSPSSSI